MFTTISCKIRSRFRSGRAFIKDEQGVSAVEFAFVLPVMLVMFFGTLETTQALYSSRKLTNTVRIIGDLATRTTTMTTTEGTTIMSAAGAVLAPFPSSGAKLLITGISISTTGATSVQWSLGRNMTPRSCGSSVAIPAGLKPAIGKTAFLVLAEGSMSYTPTIGYVMTGSITSTETMYMAPRGTTSIPFNGSGNCSSV